jgi:hypothetical protein
MKHSKLVEEAKHNPGRIYHRPHDVLRDRRLDDAARLEILDAWAAQARNPHSAAEEEQGEHLLQAVNAAREELLLRNGREQAAK